MLTQEVHQIRGAARRVPTASELDLYYTRVVATHHRSHRPSAFGPILLPSVRCACISVARIAHWFSGPLVFPIAASPHPDRALSAIMTYVINGRTWMKTPHTRWWWCLLGWQRTQRQDLMARRWAWRRLPASLSRAHRRNWWRNGENGLGFAGGPRFLFFARLLKVVH
jgi:hypothetical protein